MKIGIIDADLLGRKNHRFPNLACEKISAYWKEQGEEVSLIKDRLEAADGDCDLLEDRMLNELDGIYRRNILGD